MARKSSLNTSLSDVKFHSISIIDKEGKVTSIASLWNVIDLYESIFRPVITGYISISDGLNIRSKFAFQGEEFLIISFSKPTMSLTGSAKYDKTFRITSIEDVKISDVNKTLQYTIRFCSDELYKSLKTKINSTFKDAQYSDYVKQICTNNLSKETKSKIAAFETSTGPPQTHVINNYSPFQTIKFFEERSVDQVNSPFLFFENFLGFNFLPLSKMLEGSSVIPNGLIASTAKNGDDASDYVPLKFNEILNFELKTNDVTPTNDPTQIDLLQFDIMRNNLNLFNYNVSDMDSANKTNSESLFLNPKNIEERNANKFFVMSQNNRTPQNMVYRSFQTSRNTAISNITPYSTSLVVENNTNDEMFLAQRNSMIALLDFTKFENCEVAGNPAFTVGAVVDVNFPAFTTNQEIKRNMDPYLTGRYLITRVRHNLTKMTGLRTFLTLNSNSPGKPLF